MNTAEGWALFEAHGTDDVGYLRIERIDEDAVFEDDAAAWRHVIDRAVNGLSGPHIDALREVAAENPTEWALLEAEAARAFGIGSLTLALAGLGGSQPAANGGEE